MSTLAYAAFQTNERRQLLGQALQKVRRVSALLSTRSQRWYLRRCLRCTH